MKSIVLLIIALVFLAAGAQAQSSDISSCTKIDSKLDLNGCFNCCRNFGKAMSSMAMLSSQCACSQETARAKQFKNM